MDTNLVTDLKRKQGQKYTELFLMESSTPCYFLAYSNHICSVKNPLSPLYDILYTKFSDYYDYAGIP